jgi:hypothetical protein
MKILRLLALGCFLAGSGTAMAAPSAPEAAGLRQSVDYYLPDGRYVREYVRHYVCWRQFAGYDYYGYPVYRRVCGWR